MISLSELFLLLINCVINGSTSNMNDLCLSREMVSIPYETVVQDTLLPNFEEAHWYVFPFNEGRNAKLEILIKDDKILQSGVEIVFFNDDRNKVANEFYNEIYDLAYNHYGNSTKNYEMGDFMNISFNDNNSVFYIFKGDSNGHPFIIFRVGNKEFWR